MNSMLYAERRHKKPSRLLNYNLKLELKESDTLRNK